MPFDAVVYKETTRDQWEQAAEAWSRWGPTLEQWLGGATEAMLDAADVGPGARVLDVAGGAGGQAMAAARRTGPTGSVVVTDISPTILEHAASAAAEAGLRHVTVLEADAEVLGDHWSQEFTSAICRLGLIYLPDLARALEGIRSALVDGGRFAAVVYTTADRNAFFSVPVGIIRARAGLEPPAPGQPGPFTLGNAEVARDALVRAGFRDVRVSALDAPLRLSSAAECVRFERESFGALHQMLSGVPEDDRAGVWSEIETALGAYETADGFVGPCELLVLSGTR